MVGDGSTCLVVSGAMISWFQCTAFELKAIASLPRELRKRFVAARELQLARELEQLPIVTEAERSDLEARGIHTKLSQVCPRLISERERQARKRTKESDDATRDAPVTGTGDTRDRHDNREREEKRDRETDTPAEPVAAKRKTPQGELPSTWKPTEEHAAKAAELGVTLAYQAEAFRLHAEANARRCARWNAAFTQWLLHADPKREPTHAKQPSITTAAPRAPEGGLRYLQHVAEGKV